MDITNSDDLREKIHEIHNFMRNNGIGYGLTSLKTFNLFFIFYNSNIYSLSLVFIISVLASTHNILLYNSFS